MAAMNKSLAQSNKSRSGGEATKNRSALQSLLSWCRSGKGRRPPIPLRFNLPRPSMAGAFSVHGNDEQIFGADNKSLDGGKATKKVKPYLPPCIPGIK
jgi:hypothetical protein